MSAVFFPNQESPYIENPRVADNAFIGRQIEKKPLPVYEDVRDRLPLPAWEGHDDAVECYKTAWEIAFRNLRKADAYSGFVSNFIDTAFDGNLFMWDSTFITMFGRYGSRVFDFQRTLDNFYARQHRDGFICRTLYEKVYGEPYSRFTPSGTGPEIMEWSEWEHYQTTGDIGRLRSVFDPLLAYHEWMKENHTWRDGTYFSCGWGCGMDNQRRLPPKDYKDLNRIYFSHGHMVWADACFQEILCLRILKEMAALLHREEEIPALDDELALLLRAVNDKLWDEQDGFYYDLWPNDERSHVKTIGAFWALLADAVPSDRLPRFVAHLENAEEFNRTHRVPSLSADDRLYDPAGQYWRGSVWAPTNYMVLCGLERRGYQKLAHEIALNHLENVVKTYTATGTLWENYKAEKSGEPGNIAREDFVGWTGLSPICVLFENVFGIRSNAKDNKIKWDVRLCDKHGVRRYPLGSGTVDLLCEKRRPGEMPAVTAKADFPVTVEVTWEHGAFTVPGGGPAGR